MSFNIMYIKLYIYIYLEFWIYSISRSWPLPPASAWPAWLLQPSQCLFLVRKCCFASGNANQNDRNDNDTKNMTIREASIKHHSANRKSSKACEGSPAVSQIVAVLNTPNFCHFYSKQSLKNASPTLNIQISEITRCVPLEIESFDLSLATHVADPAGPSSWAVELSLVVQKLSVWSTLHVLHGKLLCWTGVFKSPDDWLAAHSHSHLVAYAVIWSCCVFNVHACMVLLTHSPSSQQFFPDEFYFIFYISPPCQNCWLCRGWKLRLWGQRLWLWVCSRWRGDWTTLEILERQKLQNEHT